MNSSYQKACDYIKSYQQESISKCCCLPFVQIGPTGPTGPAGPASITINQTITADPGSPASVINRGDIQNAILDFIIPAGPTGPQGIMGLQGIQGFQGEAGPIGPTGPTGRLYKSSNKI